MTHCIWMKASTSKWFANDGTLTILLKQHAGWVPFFNGNRIGTRVYKHEAHAMLEAERYYRQTVGTDSQPDQEPPSKYHRKLNGCWIDVYDILHVYDVKCPATQHAIKKLLMPGERGAKDAVTDLTEAKLAISRAIELKQTDG